MSQDLPLTADLAWRALVNGAALAFVLVVVAHLLRWVRMRLLFVALIAAALVYVWLAFRAHAGPVWLVVEAAGTIIFG